MVDIITGKNRHPLADSTIVALGTYVEEGGRLLVSGSYLGNSFSAVGHYRLQALRATRSGKIRWEQADTLPAQTSQADTVALQTPLRQIFHLETRPNERQLFAESPEGLCPADMEATRIGLYEDMRVGIGVVRESALGGKTVILGFPIEAVREWEEMLEKSIHLLREP